MIGTQIELEEKLQVLELVRHSFTKLIRIYVKECEIGEESKLLRELPSDVTMIEIDSRNGSNRVVVEHCSAKKFGVVTHIRYDPIFGERSVAVVGDGKECCMKSEFLDSIDYVCESKHMRQHSKLRKCVDELFDENPKWV